MHTVSSQVVQSLQMMLGLKDSGDAAMQHAAPQNLLQNTTLNEEQLLSLLQNSTLQNPLFAKSVVQAKLSFLTHLNPGEDGGRLLSHLAEDSISPAAHSAGGARAESRAHLLQQDGLAAFQPWSPSIPLLGELSALI